MNTYKKFCPNVFIAKCEEEYKKGDTIIVQTKYGKENECIVHNFVGYMGTKENPFYCYSIVRADGFNSQERAKKKAEKLNGYADNAKVRSDNWREKSNEGKDFLVLAEPIKVGHYSEKRHRALIERNWNRMSNSMNELDKSKAYEERAKYWESLTDVIDLSMPESLEFFKIQLEEAEEYHKGLKDKTIPRAHSYSLTYAKKKVNELKKKYEIAVKLWA
eukprot:TRINITY_DN8216_c0_g1_i7.p1 TRINITY_DN8216_c0_g1~~TRINITY_DN8216_c0_g1_i7.p1  ORF type:complete len:218 (-),score=25.55 TRINITY_DN8216_c0_g1_i7:126-779(-)